MLLTRISIQNIKFWYKLYYSTLPGSWYTCLLVFDSDLCLIYITTTLSDMEISTEGVYGQVSTDVFSDKTSSTHLNMHCWFWWRLPLTRKTKADQVIHSWWIGDALWIEGCRITRKATTWTMVCVIVRCLWSECRIHSSFKLRVRISLMARCTRYNIMW